MEPDRLAEVTDPVVREVVRDEVLAERDGLGLAQLRACARCSSTCRTASTSAYERTCPPWNSHRYRRTGMLPSRPLDMLRR